MEVHPPFIWLLVTVVDLETDKLLSRRRVSAATMLLLITYRLLNRWSIQIPKVLPNNSSHALPYLASSTSLHHALHHSTIVSLLSIFATPTAYFHVLELCSQGTLTSYMRLRDPPTLSEGELRGVLKSLVDALLYLRKELVIHRDIKPDNILLANDYRIVRSWYYIFPDHSWTARIYRSYPTLALRQGFLP